MYEKSPKQPVTIYTSEPSPEPAEMSMMEWLGTLILLGIPLLNIILLIVWAFDAQKINRANFCKATLILMVIGAALWWLVKILMG